MTGFYFIHIPKCAGTSIFNQLPTSYRNKYYGEPHIKNLKNRGLNLKAYPKTKKISLDHVSITEAYNINLINDDDIKNKDFIVTWRNPIDRFISICNHRKIKPAMLINRLKNHKKDERCRDILGRKSWYMTTTDIIKLNGKPIHTINFLFDDFTAISNQFKKYDIQIKNKHLNKSKKLYHKKHLNTNQKKFINTFYREDIIMYNTLVKEKLQAESTPPVDETPPVEEKDTA